MTKVDYTTTLGGVIPPIVTPLNADRRLDAVSAQKLCDYMLASGVHGLFVLGTSGEGPYLAIEDQYAAVEIAVKAAKSKIPVLAGLLAPGTDQACVMAARFQEIGADLVVAAPPYYYSATQAQIVEHFRSIHAATRLPVLAYDIPVTIHNRMQMETIATLANEGTIVGIKDSTGDYGGFRRLQLNVPSSFRMFSGSEQFVDSILQAGAHGVVPGLSNVSPDGFVSLYNAFRAGNQAEVSKIQSRLTRLMSVFFKPDGTVEIGRAIGAMKAALKLRGVIATTYTSRPMPEITNAEIDRIRGIMVETGFLNA